MTTYTMNTVTKQPLLSQTSKNEVLANPPATKRIFRLAPPKFTAPHISRTAIPPIQSKFAPRLVAVRQPLPHGVNYRVALPPKARIISNQANIATSLQAAVTAANTLVQTLPPPLIPARTLSGPPGNTNVMNISQKIPIMKAKLQQDPLEKKVVTAAPNVCVTERGTFVTAQVNKGAAPANTGNPIIGQSPDANAMMKKMFSVVKYTENGIVLTQVPTGNVTSVNLMPPSHVVSTQDVAAKTARPSVSQGSGPSVHKVSIGGGMGAVTSAVRSGLLTKEDRGIGHGLTNGISEKSITQGGGFSITINENNMEDTTKAVENAPRSSGVNGGNNDEKSEPPVEALSKRALWLHRRRKKKKARFTYVKGKARKKKEGEVYVAMNQDDAMGKQQQNIENSELSASFEMASVEGIDAALPKRGRPNKLEDNDGRRRGRPPKRTYCGAEEESKIFHNICLSYTNDQHPCELLNKQDAS